MNTSRIFRNSVLIVTAAAALVMFDGSAFARQGRNAKQSTVQTLSASEAAALSFMREEEKLAHDVYLTLYELWGLNIFSNIAASEQNHMNALQRLLVRYDLPDPASGASGAFTDKSLQGLYEELVLKGSESLTAALEVGVLIEKTDIADLAAAMEGTENSDLLRVYGNLTSGSENHLRAFSSLLSK